jgi:cell wall-associated NlpC family hydrolase
MPLDNDHATPTSAVSQPNFNPEADISGGRVTDLSRSQLQNAAIIYQVGMAMGMSRRDIQIGIITAMVESNLVNVNYGDRDSLGLFQQRPSQGWGTPEQVTDPQYAAGKFFSALKGLGESRYEMGMGEAAQAVQRSAFPERYAERIGAMRAMWPSIMQSAGEKPKNLDGGVYQIPGSEPLITESFDLVGGGGITSADVLEALAPNMNASITPTAKQMLGAWGMAGTNLVVDAPEQVVDPDPFADFITGTMPIINTSTNTEIIQPMAQGQEGTPFGQGVDGWRKAVIQYAKTALGTPYVWGGTSLVNGVDCSGLLQAAFAKAGINIPRVSYQQANYGTRVGIDALQPGDLVAWDNSSRNVGADHIALYIGNGQVLEAARPGTVVRVSKIYGDAYGVKLNLGK